MLNPTELLVNEVMRSLKYNQEDAEVYVTKLRKMCLIEYNREFEELTVTME